MNSRERRRIRRRDIRVQYNRRSVLEYGQYIHRILVGDENLVAYCKTSGDAESILATCASEGVTARVIDPYAIRATIESYVPRKVVAIYFESFGDVAMVKFIGVHEGKTVLEIVFMDRVASMACFAKGDTHTISRKKCTITPVFVDAIGNIPKPWSPSRSA